MITRRIYIALSILLLMVFMPTQAHAETLNQASNPACPPINLIRTHMHDKDFLKSLPPECIVTYQESAKDVNGQADQEVLAMAVGGPDTFGYAYDDTVPYSWSAASTDTGISGDDIVSDAVDIGFDFPFYGINYSQLYFNTNGGITFGAGSSVWGGFDIPQISAPNNLIAPFWDDLVVGSPLNDGAIYSSQGGTAPNRYFVLEWRDVTTWSSSPFSFEAILYENGDIIIQHQSLPSSYFSTVGIENNIGTGGLLYQSGSSGLSALKAIRFDYPPAAVRVQVSPLDTGSFSTPGGTTDFALTIINTGGLGADTYNLTVTSAWTTTLYKEDGVTLLTDTDSDGTVDTNSIPQGSAVTIHAKVTTPSGATLGSANSATVTATSSLDTGISESATLQGSVPATFAQVYKEADGAMSLYLVQPDAQVVKKAAPDGYDGYDMAVAAVPGGGFVYVFTNNLTSDIEYTLVNQFGNIGAISKLTDNSGAAMDSYDFSPSVAVAPDGTIGVIWEHEVYNASYETNSNIYFATLNASGTLLTGPTNLTNNTDWGNWGDAISFYCSPTIAASDDNRFILGWEEDVSDQHNVWYATRNTAGASVFAPAALTSDNMSASPILNSLTGGKAILTWLADVPYYAVINSSGAITKSATSLDTGTAFVYIAPDAVLLPNGKVAVAWTTDTGVQFAVLNSSYVLESGPTSAVSPSLTEGYDLSVTTDSANHVIMTWYVAGQDQLLYALGDSTGAFITQPMIYKTSANFIYSSYNGLGNAPYTATTGYAISGNAGIAGATLRYTDGISKSVTSDSSGNYSLTVPSGWSGTVTPSKTGYTFSPTSKSYSNVHANQTAQNYTATSAPAANLLQDPSFEAYTSSVYWDQYWYDLVTGFTSPLCSVADCGTGPAGSPRTGSVWSSFGLLYDWPEYAYSSLSQTVTIPSGTATLKFYLWITGAEGADSDATDIFTADIDGIPVFSAYATEMSSYPSYKLVSVDVSDYADDAEHIVTFSSETTGNTVTFNLDDVSLLSKQPSPYSLTVIKAGTGSGTVTSDLAGINCGSTCSTIYDPNTTVTLTATPAAHSTFTGWSGACAGTGSCVVSMTTIKSVTATFTLDTYSLSVGKTGTGSGTVTSSPSGINCGSTCSYSFGYNTVVTLTAAPPANTIFTGWSGAGCSGTGACVITMTAAASVTANFEALPSAFNKNTPLNNAINQPLALTLTWGSSSNMTSYEYCFETDSSTCDNDASWHPNGTVTSKALSSLDLGTTYYWQVRAVNTFGATYANGSRTAYRSFTTGDVPASFNKSSPANGATGQPLIGTILRWASSNGTTPIAYYEYCYDTTNDNTCSAWINNGISTSATLNTLSPLTTYYWQVRAVNAYGVREANANVWWAFTTKPTVTSPYYSTAANDGWVLESKEYSNTANTKMSAGSLRVGDDAKNRQYRSLLYFDTANIPNNAVIIKAVMAIKKASITVDDPFATLGNLVADMKKGNFGLSALETGDFSALAAPINTAGKFTFIQPIPPSTDEWYQLNLSPAHFKYINLVGGTQFRLRFVKDDDNDKHADFISFYADDAPTAADRPQLIIEYYVP